MCQSPGFCSEVDSEWTLQHHGMGLGERCACQHVLISVCQTPTPLCYAHNLCLPQMQREPCGFYPILPARENMQLMLWNCHSWLGLGATWLGRGKTLLTFVSTQDIKPPVSWVLELYTTHLLNQPLHAPLQGLLCSCLLTSCQLLWVKASCLSLMDAKVYPWGVAKWQICHSGGESRCCMRSPEPTLWSC